MRRVLQGAAASEGVRPRGLLPARMRWSVVLSAALGAILGVVSD